LQLRIVENIAQKIFSRASFEFAYRIPRIRYSELYNYYAPELANRFFDTITIQKGLPKILIDFSLAAFQIIAGLVVLSMYHSFFILFGVALIALVYTILVFTGPRGLTSSLKESKHKYDVAHWLEEIARTKMSFKLVSDPEIALSNTDSRVSNYINARETHFRVLLTQFISLIGFKVMVATGLLLIGSILVFRQEMNIGQFVAAEIIIILIINSVEKLIKSLDSIYDVLTALEKIGYVTDMELENEEGLKFDDNIDQMAVSVSNIKFAFPDNSSNILDDISFDVPKGESVVITGSSGSGKSTLISLMACINDPKDGVILFNGLSIQSVNGNSLRQHIGYALSNNQIFLGSVLDNISMGRESIKTQDVVNAIQMVNLEGFIKTLSLGLNTRLDPEGQRIPRSAINKIILARAIVSSPTLLLLEDPLDHVPSIEKEVIIQKLTAKNNPWSIIITAVDNIWSKYIDHEVHLDNGQVTFDTITKS
jgi:ABC-type bacteriocin/lantibiotic exporter with double-glycine peptidase domain